jgi:protein TonB
MSVRAKIGLAAALVLVTLAPRSGLGQSAAPRDVTKAAEAAQAAKLVPTYLDVVRLYVEQGRFDEAEAALVRAISAVREARRQAGLPAPEPLTTLQPGAPVRVGGAVKEPRKIRDVRPVYPEIAQQARVQGVVILEVLVDEFGLVQDAKVLRSVPLLDDAALDAVRQWAYTPTLLNGVPVPVVMTVTVNFSLH